MAKNERTLKMIEEYVELFDSGLNTVEISERYGLHYTTVYSYLEEIAQKAGRKREELLRYPHSSHINYTCGKRKIFTKLNAEEVQKSCQETLSWMDRILKEVAE